MWREVLEQGPGRQIISCRCCSRQVLTVLHVPVSCVTSTSQHEQAYLCMLCKLSLTVCYTSECSHQNSITPHHVQQWQTASLPFLVLKFLSDCYLVTCQRPTAAACLPHMLQSGRKLTQSDHNILTARLSIAQTSQEAQTCELRAEAEVLLC
jgi:hypothetical protein